MNSEDFKSGHEIDEVRVAFFCELIRNNVKIPPPVVRKLPNGRLEIVDGVQRFEALTRMKGSDGAFFSYVIDCDEETAETLREELNRVTNVRDLN